MTLHITKSHLGTTYDCPGKLPRTEQDTIHYAMSAYLYVMPYGDFTMAEFASEITKHFDVNEPRTAEVVRVLSTI